MIKHPSDTYGDKRSPILALFQKMLLTKPEDDPFLRSIKDGAFIFTYVHAQMKNRRVVMKEFKSNRADMDGGALGRGCVLCCCLSLGLTNY